MPKSIFDWVRQWYPEVRLGALLAVALSLAFPPYSVDNSPGSTAFLGCHSLFTQEAGYVSVTRLLLFWLLVLATAAFTQLSGERCSIGYPVPREMFFGRADGAAPLSGTTLLGVILAFPLWLFFLGLVLGKHRILGLEDHLAYFACTAFQLVVMSRLLLWLSREQTTLLFGYLILCAASLAWDLRTSPAPEARVGGLVPLYGLLGFLLYRFDLRFVTYPGPPPVSMPLESGPVTNLVTVPSGPPPMDPPTVPSGPRSTPVGPLPSPTGDSQPEELEDTPANSVPALEPSAEPEPSPPVETGGEPAAGPPASHSSEPNPEPQSKPEPALAPEPRVASEDPYDRYRPGR